MLPTATVHVNIQSHLVCRFYALALKPPNPCRSSAHSMIRQDVQYVQNPALTVNEKSVLNGHRIVSSMVFRTCTAQRTTLTTRSTVVEATYRASFTAEHRRWRRFGVGRFVAYVLPLVNASPRKDPQNLTGDTARRRDSCRSTWVSFLLARSVSEISMCA